MTTTGRLAYEPEAPGAGDRWRRPPELCLGCEPVCGSPAADCSGWLYCVLAAGHEPPHFDYERGIYWFKPPESPRA
jgi:hypothetical protein